MGPILPSQQVLARARILVVGDAMLDRYWFGDVERISPEAPVPIVRVRRTEERLGGAANVARNVTALGARAGVLAVIGTDEAGSQLTALISGAGIAPHVHRDSKIATTVKLRVVGLRQQMMRIDFEQQPDEEVLLAHLNEFSALLPDYDLVVLSDYGKGGLSHIEQMIKRAREASMPVLVDPKGDDYARYAGATIVTPNRAELREVVGRWKSESDLETRAQHLRNTLALDALLLTRSEEGMTLFTADGAWSVPAQAREVFDVSGAGDTVIGVLAVMLAAGAAPRDAVTIANRAGGLVVSKLGTSTVTYDELLCEPA
jgi:rfaE bifunctional protein kinase chain/domain